MFVICMRHGAAAMFAAACFFLVGSGAALAANIAPLGTGIMGVNDAADSDAGQVRIHSGTAANLVDGNPATRADTWFGDGGGDGGQTYSFAGVIWTALGNVSISEVRLILATFGDGGWFGRSNFSPAPGTALQEADLIEPVVQASTDGGATWADVDFTSDYLAVMTGHLIGGGGQPNPTSATVTFTLTTPLTEIDGLRVIGENGGLAGSDANGFLGVAEVQVEGQALETPINIGTLGTGIIGTNNTIDGDAGTAHANSGVAANVNDDNPATRVDTWNGGGTDTASFVGVLWDEPWPEAVDRLDLTLAVFFDGGWFGPNASGPGSGAVLDVTYLAEPTVQVTMDGGTTWTAVAHSSDYLTVFDGHPLPALDFGAPTMATARFTLDTPQTGIDGIRIIGTEGGTASGGFLGVFDLVVRDVTSSGDLDGDGLSNEDETTVYGTDPANPDTDGDGLSDGDEVLVYGTDPLVADTDGDGFLDGQEVAMGTDPNDGGSSPANIAIAGTAIIGTNDVVDGDAGTPHANAGAAGNANDNNPATRVDTWNGGGTDTASFVGVLWDFPWPVAVDRVDLTMAVFFDGGWFGPNGTGPGTGNQLDGSYLAEPEVQITTDGGITWTTISHTSNYLTVFDGHPLPAVDFGAPTFATARFTLDTPQAGIDGIRLIGTEGGTASGGFLGVFDLAVRDINSSGDLDGDGLSNDDEINIFMTDPANPDTDGDGLSDGDEVNVYGTNPLLADSDGDGFRDGQEIAFGTDPNDMSSAPTNIALAGTAIIGTKEVLDGASGTPYEHVGVAGNINDGNELTRVDTWNSGGTDTVSYVGIQWADAWPVPVERLELTMAIFFDGGWFGPNGTDPGAGGFLDPSYLVEPTIQVTMDGGATWTTAAHTSNYLTEFDGHPLPTVAGGAPTSATARFSLDTPQTGIDGIRILGQEGGSASGGFIGVFELAVRDSSTNDDLDSDGLSNEDETNIYNTDPNNPDTDGDGLTDGDEVLIYFTNPLLADTDGDEFSDFLEIREGTDPTDAASVPDNIALIGTGIIGTNDAADSDAGTPLEHAGTAQTINDSDFTSRVDTFGGAEGFSFVGVEWDTPRERPVDRVALTFAIFFDGGWFGPNGTGPGTGNFLDPTYLEEPVLQVSTDGGATWTDVPHESDYLNALDGHALPAVDFGPPTNVTATFTLQALVEGLTGIRLIGREGGTASSGFLGVFEMAVFTGSGSDPNLLVKRNNVFGEVVGDTTVDLNLTNNGESNTLTITGAVLSGPNSGNFTLGAVPETIAPGETLALPITFEPNGASGGFVAFLSISSNDESDPVIVVDLSAIVPNESGLAAHYPLDETEGTQAIDVSGNSHHGTYLAAGDASFTLGEPALAGSGSAVRFTPGAGGVASMEVPDSFPPFVDVSAALWFQADEGALGVQAVIAKNVQGSQGDPFAVAYTEGALSVLVAGSEEIQVAGVAAGVPHHLVVVFENSGETESARVYLNGVLEGEALGAGFDDLASSALVAAALSGAFGFQGVIDDIQIYSRAIAPEDVAFLHENPGMELGEEGGVVPGVDSDGDGASDAAEELAGTDPQDAASYLRIVSVSGGVSEFTLEWPSVEGRRYLVDRSETMAPGTWQEIGNVTGDASGMASFTDNEGVETASGVLCYRVRVDPNPAD